MKTPADIIGRHITGFFAKHEVFAIDPPAAYADRVPGLQIIEVRPGPELDLTSYVTLGCWEAVQQGGQGTEFVLTARTPDLAHVETLAAAAAQHCRTPASRLDRGSIVRLDRPWLPGSECDRLLVTLPYPYGPQFEWCRWWSKVARFLWLMPITPLEEAFVADAGVDALEERFEALGVSFADPDRRPVI